MAILAYQAFIVFSLIVIRVVARRHLATACWVWSGFTVLNLFFWPLILVQLAVVWLTYAVLKPPGDMPQVSGGPPVPLTNSPPTAAATQTAGQTHTHKTGDLEAPRSTLGMVGKTVAELSCTITRASAVQEATSQLNKNISGEQFAIESRLDIARKAIQLEAFFAKDSGNQKLYEESRARISRLLDEASPRNDKQKPSLDFTVPDFSLPPRHADVTIADAIEECIRELQRQRESFFTNLKQTLDRDLALHTNFFKAMEDSSHIKIWAEFKTRFQPSASVAKAPPLTCAQNRISFQQILKEPVVTPVDEHERILQIIEADEQEDAELAWRRIQELATERSIRYLVHFTRVGNLSSIMSHGLLSVQAAHKQGLVPLANDQLRLDGRTDAISLSISFPNDAMFYKYRQLHPQERWVVLLLSPEILWTRSCAFCRHNAADRRIRSRPWSELTTSEAFQSMFAEALDGASTRAAQGLGLSDPTDVQAEMLVQSYIHPSKVIQMVFEHSDDLQAHRHHTGGRHARVQVQGSDVFASRRFLRKTGSVA